MIFLNIILISYSSIRVWPFIMGKGMDGGEKEGGEGRGEGRGEGKAAVRKAWGKERLNS